MAACAVDACEKAARKRGWCDRHYQAWRRHGDPRGGTGASWNPQASACLVCGSTRMQSRRFCSANCHSYWYRQQKRKTAAAETCSACGCALNVRRVEGKSIGRSNRRFCDSCRGELSRKRRASRLAVRILAHYQGVVCGICGEDVDMELKRPDPRSPSLDHIVPLAAGGDPEDVANIRLAHLICNVQKENYWQALTTTEAVAP